MIMLISDRKLAKFLTGFLGFIQTEREFLQINKDLFLDSSLVESYLSYLRVSFGIDDCLALSSI